jgi:hypothetical protein
MVNPFSESRKHVWDGANLNDLAKDLKERFLCHALLRACDEGTFDQDTYMQAVGMIQRRMGEHKFLESWLCCEGGVRVGEMTHERIQFYRFRWLNELEQLWNQGERK